MDSGVVLGADVLVDWHNVVLVNWCADGLLDWRRPQQLPALGGAAGFGLFFLLGVLGRGALGFGDVKLAGVIGLMTGFPGVLVALLTTKRATRKSEIAYAPYPAAAR